MLERSREEGWKELEKGRKELEGSRKLERRKDRKELE
jgi:hypothetical protein